MAIFDLIYDAVKAHKTKKRLISSSGQWMAMLHIVKPSSLRRARSIVISTHETVDVKCTLDSLMSKTSGGGTVFSSGMVTLINELVGSKFNVLIVSDSDILTGMYQKVVLKHKQRVYSIFATRNDFELAVKFLGVNIKSLTYLRD